MQYNYVVAPNYTSYIYSIDDSGKIFGWADSPDIGNGFFYLDGTYTVVPGSGPSVDGANASGVFIGTDVIGSIYPSEGFFGTTQSDETVFRVPNGGIGYSTTANGINDLGVIVGGYGPGNGYIRSTSGTFTTLFDPSGTATDAFGINDSGDVVGNYTDSQGDTDGFLYNGSSYATLDFPGAIDTDPMAINNLGEVVGTYTDTSGKSHGFLYRGNGVWVTIDAPYNPYGIIANTVLTGINDEGQITGYVTDGQNGNGTATGFYLTLNATPNNDFIANGKSDFFWQNTTSGAIGEWLTDPAGSGLITSAPSIGFAAGYTIIGTGDFNGDGTSDILTEQSNGALGDWLMSDGQIFAAPYLGTVAANYNIVAIGNFADNGLDDIFWQDSSTGEIGEWLMDPNGSGLIASAPALGLQPESLQILGAGDFTGNGTDDVFWQETDGTVGEWLMQNGQIASGITLGGTPAGLQVLGFGDFTGNGTDDVFWRDGNTVGEWLMQNGQIDQSITLGNVASTWQFVGTGDFTGNGTDDVVWRDSSSGNLVEWQMANGQISQAPLLGNVAANVKMILHA